MTTPRLRAALFGALLASCHSNTIPSNPPAEAQPARAAAPKIEELELARLPSPELRALLENPDTALRKRAAIAIGRVGLDGAAAYELGKLLSDPATGDEAAWALGRLPEPKPEAGKSIDAKKDPRSEFPAPVSPESLLRGCVASRCASAVAAARALGGQPRTAETLAVLTAALTSKEDYAQADALAGRAATALGVLARLGGKGSDDQVAATAREPLWKALASGGAQARKGAAYALGRIPREPHPLDEAKKKTLLAALADPDAETRALAARAAGKQQLDAESLRGALDDPDWRVEVEAARALSSAPGAGKIVTEAIAKSSAKLAATHVIADAKWAHVLGELFASAAKIGIPSNSLPAGGSLTGPTPASTLAVRCALAEAKDRLAQAPFETKGCGAGLEPEWRSRLRLAALAGELAGDHRDGPAGHAAIAGLRDPDARVRSAAAQSVSMAFGDELIELLADPDPVVVSSAASSLAKDSAAARTALPAASKAIARFIAGRGAPAGDPRSDALGALADLITAGLAPIAQPHPQVPTDGPLTSTTTPPPSDQIPEGARLLLADQGDLDPHAISSPPLYHSLLALLAEVDARAHRDAPRTLPASIPPPLPKEAQAGLGDTKHLPRTLILATSAGPLRIHLDAEDAPLTVAALAALTRRGFYDQLLWHRVVPDFVAQGGDPLGDGEGGPGWSLPDEHSPREFKRGTLGIATSGPDTGGSQIFLCHSPQPHLDGRYTIAGELESGGEVLDALQVGDSILSASVE